MERIDRDQQREAMQSKAINPQSISIAIPFTVITVFHVGAPIQVTVIQRGGTHFRTMQHIALMKTTKDILCAARMPTPTPKNALAAAQNSVYGFQ